MRTVCLCTPVEDPERYARAQSHFAEVGLGKVEYLHGLHKSQSGLDTSHLYMVDRPKGHPDYGVPYGMGPHPVNIWLGHYMAWQALKLSGDDRWLILETDAKFPEGHNATGLIEKAMQHMDSLDPNFDLLYVGSCACAGSHRVNRRLYDDTVGHRAIATIFGNGPQCNHGYVIRAKAVPTFESTLRKIWAPIDVQQTSETFEYGSVLPRSLPFNPPARKLVVYTVLPRIVEQWNTNLTE